MTSRQALLERCVEQLSAFRISKDPFRVFTQVTSGVSAVPAQRPRTLVVLDSSFNPPTWAHLRMATSAVRAAAAHRGQSPRDIRLLLLLAVNNADKKPKAAAFPFRMEMMRLFAQDLLRETTAVAGAGPSLGEEGLAVDLGLTLCPYFHDKSRAIAASGVYGEETEHVVLAGFDTLIRIFDPKYYKDGMRAALDPFFARARLRITMRTDDEWGGEAEQLEYLRGLRDGKLENAGGRTSWCDGVDMVAGSAEVVSSTKAREAASRGDAGALDALLSPSVKDFVLECCSQHNSVGYEALRGVDHGDDGVEA